MTEQQLKSQEKELQDDDYDDDPVDEEEALEYEDVKAQIERLKKINEKWLSLTGWSTGLTGLARDFVWNYLGKPNYHKNNSGMISGLKKYLEFVLECMQKMGEKLENKEKEGKELLINLDDGKHGDDAQEVFDYLHENGKEHIQETLRTASSIFSVDGSNVIAGLVSDLTACFFNRYTGKLLMQNILMRGDITKGLNYLIKGNTKVEKIEKEGPVKKFVLQANKIVENHRGNQKQEL